MTGRSIPRTIALVALLASGGCGQTGNAPPAQAVAQAPDETDLDCAALIYANANLLDKDGGQSFGGYVAAMTSYATKHASANGLDAGEALGVVKLRAYRMAGTIASDDSVDHEEIATRAKACSAAVSS